MQYKGRRYKEVDDEKGTCEGCIFEFHEIGEDCLGIQKRKCGAMEREDGREVIFKYVKPRKMKPRA